MDTLDGFKRLKAAGLSDAAAEAVMETMRDNLVEKSDLSVSEERMKSEMERKVFRSEIRVLGYFVFGVLLSGALWKFFGG